MSEWIKTINEMPAQGQSVLVFSKSLGVSSATYWAHQPGVHEGDSGFCTECGDELFPVTYWQAYPEHPTS